ncbi:thioredoxin-like protein [Gaertneriomyces semiglobifer]|nr:thioredoxin-like protein [Gaertneriomyces semiglobifer]
MTCTDGVCTIDWSKRRQAAASSSKSEASAKVEDAIKQHKVVIYSKTYCPYCEKAKELLKGKNVDFYTVELDSVDDGEAMHEYLKTKSGQSTVPNIYINERHVGGFSDLSALDGNGELKALLNA